MAAGPARQPSGSAPAATLAPELDLSARKALVDEAVGKSSREVMRMLAGVDPDLAAPADRLRPLDAERWELKTVIDTECQRGLEQLKGLLSHVDPHMTIGQLVGRRLDRHDPARPSRRAHRPAGRRSAGAERTSAPKQEVYPCADADPTRNRPEIHAGSAASTAKPQTAPARNSTSAPEPPRDTPAHALSVVRRPAKPTASPAPAPKPLRDSEAPAPSNSERFRAAGGRHRFGGHAAAPRAGGSGRRRGARQPQALMRSAG